MLWSVGVDVDCLVADPTGPIATAFVPSKQDTTHCESQNSILHTNYHWRIIDVCVCVCVQYTGSIPVHLLHSVYGNQYVVDQSHLLCMLTLQPSESGVRVLIVVVREERELFLLHSISKHPHRCVCVCVWLGGMVWLLYGMAFVFVCVCVCVLVSIPICSFLLYLIYRYCIECLTKGKTLSLVQLRYSIPLND